MDHGPLNTTGEAGPSVAPNGASHSEAGQTKPGGSQPGGTTGQKQMEHICFGCGQAGHIQANCPNKKARSHAAAAVRIQKEVDTGTTGNIAPTDDTQEGETPPEDEDTEQEYFLLGEEDLPRLPLGKMNTRCPSITGTTKTMTLGHCLGRMPSVPQRWGTA